MAADDESPAQTRAPPPDGRLPAAAARQGAPGTACQSQGKQGAEEEAAVRAGALPQAAPEPCSPQQLASGLLEDLAASPLRAAPDLPELEALVTPLAEEGSDWRAEARLHARLLKAASRQRYQPAFPATAPDVQPLLGCLEERLYPWLEGRSAGAARRGLQGRGIVVCIGAAYFEKAATFLASLSAIHGSWLPIRVFLADEGELPAALQAWLARLPRTSVSSLAAHFPGAGPLAGYALKPFALLAAGFAEAILVDADVMLYVPPEALFQQPQYRQTGALFFPDRTTNSLVPPDVGWLQQLLRPGRYAASTRLLTGGSQNEHDSGVVVLNVARHLAPLLITARLNHGALGEETYGKVHGDKETFFMGLEVAGEDWAVSAGELGAVEHCSRTEEGPHACSCWQSPEGLAGLESPWMVQTDAEGALLWLHFSLDKANAFVRHPLRWAPGADRHWHWDLRGTFCTYPGADQIRQVSRRDMRTYAAHVALAERVRQGLPPAVVAALPAHNESLAPPPAPAAGSAEGLVAE